MYQIGQLATIVGVSNDTLRYYEKHQLILPATRSESGYRLYNEQSLSQIRFIQRAKLVGFSLKEIKELLSLKVEPEQHSCEEVKSLTKTKLDDVKNKIAELKRIEDALQTLHDRCCGGIESAENCSILDTLTTGQGME